MTLKTLPLHTNGHQVWPKTEVRVNWFEDHPDWPPMVVESLFCCSWCGEYPRLDVKDDGVYIPGDRCAYVDGGITTVTQLHVPSGKIIISTDLRPAYDGFKDEFASYTSVLGVAQVIEEFAKQGCMFGFVGDRWPDLFQTGEDTYVLASPMYSDGDEPEVPASWKMLAETLGAVWAYSVADYEDWKARGGKPEHLEHFEVVEIPAGTYEFTYHGGESGFDRHAGETIIFTEIRKVG
jgi:hypothetical protein